MTENKDIIINLPLGETLRRCFSYFTTHIVSLTQISFVWFLILLTYDTLSGFPSLCSLNQKLCNDGTAENISFLALSISSIAVAIAYMRQIVLNEKADGVMHINFGKRELKYIWTGLLFVLIVAAIMFVVMSVFSVLATLLHINENLFSFMFFLVLLFILALCSRLLLVFPAVALDDENMNFVKSFKITKGNTLKIFLGQIILMLPILIFLFILSYCFNLLESNNILIKVMFTLCLFILSFIDAGLKATFFAHIYQYFMYFYQKKHK